MVAAIAAPAERELLLPHMRAARETPDAYYAVTIFYCFRFSLRRSILRCRAARRCLCLMMPLRYSAPIVCCFDSHAFACHIRRDITLPPFRLLPRLPPLLRDNRYCAAAAQRKLAFAAVIFATRQDYMSILRCRHASCYSAAMMPPALHAAMFAAAPRYAALRYATYAYDFALLPIMLPIAKSAPRRAIFILLPRLFSPNISR